MKFPDWNKIFEKISKLEKDISQKIENFNENHPLTAEALKISIQTFAPKPFDSLLLNILNKNQKEINHLEQGNTILTILKEIKEQNEKHYEDTIIELNKTLEGVDDLKLQNAKEDTAQLILDVLRTTGREQDTKLVQLNAGILELKKTTNEILDYVTGIDRMVTANHNILQGRDNEIPEIHDPPAPNFNDMAEIFEGRDNLVDNIADAFKKNDKKVISTRNVMSGIGKTQIALQVLHKWYFEKRRHVIILNMDEQLEFRDFIREIDIGLGISHSYNFMSKKILK